MKCIGCESNIDSEATFCPQCGRDQRAIEICSSCEMPLKPGARFCHHCGNQASVTEAGINRNGLAEIGEKMKVIFYAIFPDMLTQKKTKRTDYWITLLLFALLTAFAVGLVGIGLITFLGPMLGVFLANLLGLYTFGRLWGHTYIERLNDSGLDKSHGFKVAGNICLATAILGAVFTPLAPIGYLGLLILIVYVGSVSSLSN